jgi:membrane-associated phospholipid phosphatase
MPRAFLHATVLGAVLATSTGCSALPSRPHGSPVASISDHLDPAAWREYVGRDYFGSGDAVLPAALAVGAALVAPADGRLQEAISGSLGDSAAVGDVGVSALVVGSLALGALRPGPGRHPWDQTWSNFEALWITYGLTEVGRAAFERGRPAGSSRASMPSGHAAIAFAAATLVHREAGPAWGIPAYGVAGLTAWSRVEADRHFPSDVLVGAALGCLVAGAVDSLHFGSGPGRGIAGRCHLHAGPTDQGIEIGLSVDL